MCECLMELEVEGVKTDEEVCDLQVHTTYHVKSSTTQQDGCTAATQGETEFCVHWLREDEI